MLDGYIKTLDGKKFIPRDHLTRACHALVIGSISKK